MYLKEIFQKKKLKINSIYEKSLMIIKTNNVLQSILPNDLKFHCHVANIENKTLKLISHNANWTTRIRFIIPEIKKKLHNNNLYYSKIICITSP